MKQKIPVATPIKSIRLKCLECTNYQYSLIAKCTCKNCPLYFYRFGNNPNRAGIGGNPNLMKSNKHTSVFSLILKNIKNFKK
jgi:hypothetical protein